MTDYVIKTYPEGCPLPEDIEFLYYEEFIPIHDTIKMSYDIDFKIFMGLTNHE